MVVHRKLSKDELRYPRFFFYAPVQKPGKDDMMLRTHHFRVRLFEHLPWIAFQKEHSASDHDHFDKVGDYIFSIIPRIGHTIPPQIDELVEVSTLSTHIHTQEEQWNDLTTIRVTSEFITTAPDPPYELLCMT